MVVAREVDVNTKLPSWLAMGWECNPQINNVSYPHTIHPIRYNYKKNPRKKPKHVSNLCS
jgi:hypothetical protein